MSFIVLMINAALSDLILYRKDLVKISRAAPGAARQGGRTPWLILMAFVFVILGGSLRLVLIIRSESRADSYFEVVVIQQNRDPRKHNFSESFDFAIDLTRKAISDTGGISTLLPCLIKRAE